MRIYRVAIKRFSTICDTYFATESAAIEYFELCKINKLNGTQITMSVWIASSNDKFVFFESLAYAEI